MKTALCLVALPFVLPLAFALILIGGAIVLLQILTSPPEAP